MCMGYLGYCIYGTSALPVIILDSMNYCQAFVKEQGVGKVGVATGRQESGVSATFGDLNLIPRTIVQRSKLHKPKLTILGLVIGSPSSPKMHIKSLLDSYPCVFNIHSHKGEGEIWEPPNVNLYAVTAVFVGGFCARV